MKCRGVGEDRLFEHGDLVDSPRYGGFGFWHWHDVNTPSQFIAISHVCRSGDTRCWAHEAESEQ